MDFSIPKDFTKKVGSVVAIVIALLYGWNYFGGSTPDGYYLYNGDYYYLQDSSWYIYSVPDETWAPTQSLSGQITKKNASQYRAEDFHGWQFENTSLYRYVPEKPSLLQRIGSFLGDLPIISSDDSDWDSSDSWDSNDTDFDSDW